jgi:hypothetical protein
MVTIHLALSEGAARELKRYLDGEAPERPPVMDDIVAELVSQLNEPGRERTPTPIEVGLYDLRPATSVARDVAEAMAAAGAEALNPKAA